MPAGSLSVHSFHIPEYSAIFVFLQKCRHSEVFISDWILMEKQEKHANPRQGTFKKTSCNYFEFKVNDFQEKMKV